VKHEFVHEHGKLIEKLVIDQSVNWIYINYTKGNFEKSAYTLKKSSGESIEFIKRFIEDNQVSENIKLKVEKVLYTQRNSLEESFQEFINFLVTTLSLHLIVGFSQGLSIYGGFQLGQKMDIQLNIYPAFTITGILAGIAIGSLVGYGMMVKYLGSNYEKGRIPGNKTMQKKRKSPEEPWLVIDVSPYVVAEAVRNFAANLPKGMDRTILVKSDFSIDFDQLAPYLNGIPNHPFYMSIETYEIFEESCKEIPPILDKVQKAVHLFYKNNKNHPIRPYDPLQRVNYHQLQQDHYLDEIPKIELYFTGYEGLLTSQKPVKLKKSI
jgi:hypothetical protein